MAKRKFKVDVLSQASIKQLKKDLRTYRDDLQRKCRLLAQLLAEKGVSIAKVKIATLGAVFTGELISSVHIEEKGSTKSKTIFAIVVDSKHAAFVEFGTGQMGEEGGYPHPFPPGVDWEYNTGKTIFEISPGEYGWFYFRDGEWHFTQGMPSRPFMYETFIELKSIVEKTAREVFKE